MGASALDLTTLANVKSWLKMEKADNDDDLQRLITATSQFVKSWLNRDIKSAAYTEYRDGHGGSSIIFSEQPMISFTSLTVDGTLVDPSQYSTNPQGLYLNGGCFRRAKNNVVMAYTAGFATVPMDVEQAIIETVSLRWQEHFRIGQISKSIAGETVSFVLADFPASAKSILNQYKKVIPLI